MKRNRTISVFLILSMLAACFVCPVFAADGAAPQVSIRVAGENVQVNATLPNGAEGDVVNYMIVTEDTTQEMLDGQEGDLTPRIKALDTGKLGALKSVSVSVRLGAEVETGTYKLVLSSVVPVFPAAVILSSLAGVPVP